jgi:hypothetical protein
VPTQYVNLNLLVPLVVWVLVGLLAYWARQSKRPDGPAWLVVYMVGGALMLVFVAWDYIQAGEEARRRSLERARNRKAGKPAPATATAAAGATGAAAGSKRGKGQGGKGQGGKKRPNKR